MVHNLFSSISQSCRNTPSHFSGWSIRRVTPRRNSPSRRQPVAFFTAIFPPHRSTGSYRYLFIGKWGGLRQYPSPNVVPAAFRRAQKENPKQIRIAPDFSDALHCHLSFICSKINRVLLTAIGRAGPFVARLFLLFCLASMSSRFQWAGGLDWLKLKMNGMFDLFCFV